jgi:hypothetical protein
LVQGFVDKQKQANFQFQAEKELQLKKELKAKFKKESQQMDLEYGLVEPDVEIEPKAMPEWKKQKMFMTSTFPSKIICRKFNDKYVFKNKQSMQEYQHAVLTEEEWTNNLNLLAEMRRIYDDENGQTSIIAVDII